MQEQVGWRLLALMEIGLASRDSLNFPLDRGFLSFLSSSGPCRIARLCSNQRVGLDQPMQFHRTLAILLACKRQLLV